MIVLNAEQEAMLRGERGTAKQMGMRLVLDMAAAAGADELVAIQGAHLSGVSPLTGGMGLRRFLSKLAMDPLARVSVPTTLNSAGCDAGQYEEMRIAILDFLEHSLEIVALYEKLGVQPTQSCVPYEWEGVVATGPAAWSESNAICFGNSYTGLLTNRESGLSALAAALTGYTPAYGLLEESARRPNLEVVVDCTPVDPADFSIFGDWIGKQRKATWQMPLGPIPLIRGIRTEPSHDERKALSAAAANYGCALLYIEGEGEIPEAAFQDRLVFTEADLVERYRELRPTWPASLVVLGCPQASVSELRAVAQLLQGKEVSAVPLWVFTSSANRAIAEHTGIAAVIRESGALLLENTCPEVVPYDQAWVRHILTNSMKAEHYIQSGLNGIPTSVMRLADCIAVATGELALEGAVPREAGEPAQGQRVAVTSAVEDRPTIPFRTDPFESLGQGLPSQTDFVVAGEAFVTNAPITLLGFVNRETGVIEEPGHPANGHTLAGKIAIFPRGTGSTVAPYVLLELFYRGKAPLAIVNTDIDQQSAPACSLEAIPYAYGFDADVIGHVNNGDQVELRREGGEVRLRVLQRREAR